VLFVVVRVRLVLRRGDRVVETVALAKSGYEAVSKVLKLGDILNKS